MDEKKYILKKQALPLDLRVDYRKELNEEQLAVVAGGDGPCLVLAGAGSGKTRTIVYRVSYLLEKGVPPERILLLTFTNKAAREMIGRVKRLAGLEDARLWGGTFHHVCHRILREAGERVGLRRGFTILDAEDAKDLMKSCVRDCEIDPKERRFPSPSVLLSVSSYASNVGWTVEDALQAKHPSFLANLVDIERCVGRYMNKKRESNALDFDDLLLLTLKLLRTDAGAREKYATQFRYVLVDEYQDTNPIQAEIVEQLSSVHNNVLVVGDDAQSIYSFRGADIGNILNFPKRFPGAKMFKLETNYRSTPEILDLANDVISRNVRQFPKELKAVKDGFAKPQVVSCSTAQQEAEYVAQRILELRDEGVSLREMAVLFRAAHHSQAVEFELMKRNIPYDYRGGLKFFERAHVKDVLAYLRIVVNKEDVVAWTRVLSLQVGVGSATAGRLFERVKSVSGPEDIDETLAEGMGARASAGWRAFIAVWNNLMKKRPDPSGMLREVLTSDYLIYLENEYPDFKDRLEDLETLAEFAESYEDASVFLSDTILEDRLSSGKLGLSAQTDDEEKMILSTVHQAKGLEWDAVFVIHMNQGQFPNKRALVEDGGVEEERRLLYVAVTRARRDLSLSYPLSIGYGYDSGFGDSEGKSMFIDEIAPRLYEKVGVEESWDEPAIQIDTDGEMIRPRKGLLRDISEY